MSCSAGLERLESEDSVPMSREGSIPNLRDFDEQDTNITPSTRRGAMVERPGATPTSQLGTPTITLTASDLERVIKRAQAPLLDEMKTLTKKMTDMSKQMTRVENSVSTMDKKSKQILDAVDKKKVPLDKLFRQAGCIQLKSICIQNLHVEAHSPDEKQLLDEFMDDAKENGWLLEETAKAVNDVKLRFREERHTLKQQIRDHLKLDFTGNADPDMAAELTRTKAYLMKHVGDIIPGVELLVYHMASIMAKYLNSKKVMVDNNDKKAQGAVREDLYGYLHKRMKKDSSTIEDLKKKIIASLAGGFKFSGGMRGSADK